MNHIRLRAIAAIGVTTLTFGCGDIPILPQWDADLYAPIGAANLAGVTPGLLIPGGTALTVAGPVRRLDMDGTAGDALGEVLDDAAPVIRLEVRLTKSANLAVSLADTIYLAADSASLATTPVLGGVAMGAGETTRTDTLDNIPGLVPLLQGLVNSGGTLHLQARGRVANGGSDVTVQATDSIHVQVGLLVRVPVTSGN
jgi:hypothetical protein